MQVKEVIAILEKHYQPDDNIVIGWWDKDWFVSAYHGTNRPAEQIAEVFDNNTEELDEALSSDWTADLLTNAFDECLDNNSKPEEAE